MQRFGPAALLGAQVYTHQPPVLEPLLARALHPGLDHTCCGVLCTQTPLGLLQFFCWPTRERPLWKPSSVQPFACIWQACQSALPILLAASFYRAPKRRHLLSWHSVMTTQNQAILATRGPPSQCHAPYRPVSPELGPPHNLSLVWLPRQPASPWLRHRQPRLPPPCLAALPMPHLRCVSSHPRLSSGESRSHAPVLLVLHFPLPFPALLHALTTTPSDLFSPFQAPL
mmetsp:Transcript_33911/g.77370  ORF Transcript_33911/g.77370 Transcript_33911/m.77370 type:complete len:228 (+) Transcript_33911:750-1433(+)